MFKNVLSSLNGSIEHANGARRRDLQAEQQEQEQEPAQDQEVPASRKSNVSESAASSGSTLAGKRSLKMMSVKRGRKKLSSMMSKLRSVSSASSKQKADEGEGDEGDEDGEAPNWDSDDEAYKSAEEACRKMSLADNGADEPRRRVSLARSGRRNSATAANQTVELKRTATETETAAAADGYEQLKEDKKYILPEEQCDIPTFLETKNCDPYLIEETRKLLKERYAKNPDNFYDADYDRMLTDDWTVSRFLLRRRLNPKRTAKLMEECGRFRKQYKMSEVMLWEFPMEFHKAGGLFKYAPDRVGNVTMYMRVKMYRRVPEISDVFKAFILCVLEQCDVANNGRGTAVIFDLTACGLQNVDLGFLSWLLSSFRNYCPKGVSYILVYNLPWILNATCKIAMTWMSASNKRALRFVYGDEIENFIDKSNLPDYLGGHCKLNYRAIPAGSKRAIEVCDRLDMTREQAIKIRELFKEYLDDDLDEQQQQQQQQQEQRDAAAEHQANQRLKHNTSNDNHDETKSHYDDAKSSTSFGSLGEPDAPTATSATTIGAITSNNATLTTNPNGRAPVVDLVSQASKFVAH